MSYKKIFSLSESLETTELVGRAVEDGDLKDCEIGDRRDGRVYLYTEKIILAVNVALATGRPLLIRGPSGSGKSSLAYNIARLRDARYYEFVVTSRSKARDLLWTFDAVRRLGDAQSIKDASASEKTWKNHFPYIQPGVLWWIFDSDSAMRRGWSQDGELPFEKASDLAEYEPRCKNSRTVLLVDEIDKADPDFANNLLVPFGSFKFRVAETQTIVRLKRPDNVRKSWEFAPLLIITTNDERSLPDAFLRRCLVFNMTLPDKEHLIKIAEVSEGPGESGFYENILDAILDHQGNKLPNIPQYLDAIRACRHLADGKNRHPSTFLSSMLDVILKKEQR